jgi:hypothetical protein
MSFGPRNTVDDPLDRGYVASDLVTTPRLSLFRWAVTVLAGCRDGLRGVLDQVDLTESGAVNTFWLQTNSAAYAQADRQEFLAMQARVAAPIRALAALARERIDREADLAAQHEQLESLMKRDRPTLEGIVRGPAEESADDVVVLARRQRRWEQPVQVVRNRIAELEQRIRDIDTAAAPLVAVITVAHQVAVSRSERVHQFYERTAETYRRALSRSAANGAEIQAAGINTVTLLPSAWMTAPTTWIPEQYRNSTITEQKETADVL